MYKYCCDVVLEMKQGASGTRDKEGSQAVHFILLCFALLFRQDTSAAWAEVTSVRVLS